MWQQDLYSAKTVMSRPQIILGTGMFGRSRGENVKFDSAQSAQDALNVFKIHGHSIIDTSRNYPSSQPGASEELLGKTDARSWATLDSKTRSDPGDHQPGVLTQSVEESLAALKVPAVRTMYLHMPDHETPLEIMLEGMHNLYKQGKFNRLGLSNYAIDEVKQILSICRENGFVKPSVYQGLYNAVARDAEKELIPLLHENGIAFYAYSPAAGGVFNRDVSSRLNSEGPVGQRYRGFYGNAEAQNGITKVCDAAFMENLTGHAVALRWLLHHSMLSMVHGDAIVVGAGSSIQLEETLRICDEGPLPEALAQLVDTVR